MTAAVQDLIHSFERLSEEEQQEAAVLILRRSTQFDLPPLSGLSIKLFDIAVAR